MLGAVEVMRKSTGVDLTAHPDKGRPVGLQVVGRRYADETVLAASAALEAQLGSEN